MELPLGFRHLGLHRRLGSLRFVEQPLGFGLRLAHDHLPLTLGGGARILPQLLRRDERLVHRLFALAEDAQLLREGRHALFEHLAVADGALQRICGAHAKVLDAAGLIAAQTLAELLLADVVRREVEDVVVHALVSVFSRGPNRAVPSRIIVAPSATAVA